MLKKSLPINALLLLLLVTFSAFKPQQSIPLSGTWLFQIDHDDKGVTEKWYLNKLSDEVKLPGSMAQNLKGDDITLKTRWTGSIYDSSFYYNPHLAKYRQPGNIHIPFWLTPAKHYVGVAWYQKEVNIPKTWARQRINLFLERAHIETRVFIDGKEAGMQNSLVAPHEYDLTPYLTPGLHRISIRIDNRIKEINVGPDSHSLTDHTQGNWNGIIGKMELQAYAPVYITNLQIYPNVKNKTAVVKLQVQNNNKHNFSGQIGISAKSFNSKTVHQTPIKNTPFTINAGASKELGLTVPMGTGVQLWDEFSPSLYNLTVSVNTNGKSIASQTTEFGMREFTIKDNTFLINGRPVFLRGTVNNCEFPLTGYPATSVDDWLRIFKIARAHGLNHMRFHSWCPPEAAFKAADRTGFYLQPEGPSWPNHGSSIGRNLPIDKYLYDETNRMDNYYGNYASFCMLSAGNEPAGNQVQYLNAFIDYWKKKDTRKVYTGMSVGGSWPVVPDAQYQVRGGVRGLAWDKQPESQSDFSAGIAKFNVPFVAHEMGQWCVFPDFDEIKEYTGVYRAKNFELFQQDLKDQGMGSQAHDFMMASGKLQTLCYKNEIEKTLRTPGYAGFQLLGLQDFPGQGTALVGVLNAFWKQKGYVAPAEFARFCNTTVPLVQLPKFVFNNNETLNAGVMVAHSGKAPLQNAIFNWSIKTASGSVIAQGAFQPKYIDNGNGIPVGQITWPLNNIKEATKLKIEVSIANTPFANDWEIWVYPVKASEVKTEVYYTTSLDDKAKAVLDKGGKVFLNVAGQVVKGKEVAMHFLPVFWNTSWFKMRPPHVTGMLIQDKSAAFAGFPTEYHSNLQWWEIANRAQVMVLEDFPAEFKPLVQPIDTWFLNRRLALIYEAKVGNGKIIVSSAALSPALGDDKPAARQLFNSLMQYMASDKFNPTGQVSFDVVKDILVSPTKYQFNTFTKDSPDELKPNSNQNKSKTNE
ncbi:exo-beta-1,4-galactosidase [Mucilaginibacter aquatilis]|uniref:beta-galactosidase n=1 Tax=Mucilaginibacter aquatilis TaxID=1517760 RepID=A0A6I4IAD5_9SPHI|nr:sugar-binding domain-containing protein [Mucilaginibacter aquatilis]MVN92135.1 beta-glucuronidase [Mucilaginibacter aquatilis]